MTQIFHVHLGASSHQGVTRSTFKRGTYCITFYEQPLSNYPGDDTRTVERAGADRRRGDRACLFNDALCDESNMGMVVYDE